VVLKAPAKVNLHLRVISVRDDGMHELDTSFAYVDVWDELGVREAAALQVTCSLPGLSGEKNLVYRVLQAFRQYTGITQGLHVHIDKRLPMQAGLGGGSSDAASALMAANRLWQVDMATESLIEFAAPLGADIPCFLFGQASRASGIGEVLEVYADALPKQSVLLAWPGEGVSTPEVFRHFDASHAACALTAPQAVDTMRPVSERLGSNDLEISACAISPAIGRLLATVRAHAQTAWMSGSGSTCVALFDELRDAQMMADRLRHEGLASWTHVGSLLRSHPEEFGA